jgi:hypothetical protein
LNRYNANASGFALLLFLLKVIWKIKLSRLQRLLLFLNHLMLKKFYLLSIWGVYRTVRIALRVWNFVKMRIIIDFISHYASCRILIVLYWSESISTVYRIISHNNLVYIVLTSNYNQLFWTPSMLDDSHGLVHVLDVLLTQRRLPQDLLTILGFIARRCQMFIRFHSWIVSFSRAHIYSICIILERWGFAS